MILELVFVDVGGNISRQTSNLQEREFPTIAAETLLAEDWPSPERQGGSEAQNKDHRKGDDGNDHPNGNIRKSLGDARHP